MRIHMAPYVAIALSTMVLFLVTTPQESSANPIGAAATTAMVVLGPVIESFLGDLRTKKEAEQIEIRLWMHTDDKNINGCGLFFAATGYSGKNVFDWFPDKKKHKCREVDYEFRMMSQSAMYTKRIRLGNDQTKEIQVHADGWRDTFIKTMCFGLSERTTLGGPRAFCIDNNTLKTCKALTNKWNDIDLTSTTMKLTRSTRGIHKIIFTDIENLIIGFETLAGNPEDMDAVRKVCDRINLEKGTGASTSQVCEAKKTWTQSYGSGMTYSYETKTKDENINPDGCTRFED